MRGPGAERLPAVVREHVTPTSCWSDQAPAFWTAMGASVEYEVVREGQVYTCIHEGYEMKVGGGGRRSEGTAGAAGMVACMLLGCVTCVPCLCRGGQQRSWVAGAAHHLACLPMLCTFPRTLPAQSPNNKPYHHHHHNMPHSIIPSMTHALLRSPLSHTGAGGAVLADARLPG